MSGDSSLGIGIGLALKSYGRAVSYVKIGRVLDLTTPFSELTFTLADKSGEGNDATLYSGRYISTDGSTDRGIVADCSAAGAGNYYLTGKVRPNAVTTAELTMDGSTDSGLTGLTADVWQTFTTATSAVTPSAVQVGYDGSTASAADWSDVKLIDSSDGSTVARWQLNESADGDLNGYPALDSSGNGYHGTHVGCAGGTGEGIDADVAGAVFAANEAEYWFDGVDDYRETAAPVVSATGDFDFTFTWYIGNSVDAGTFLYAFSQGTSATDLLGVALGSGAGTAGKVLVYHCNASPVFQSASTYFQSFVKIRLKKVSGNLTVYLDDAPQTPVAVTGSISQTNARWGDTTFLSGNRHAVGMLYGDDVTGTVNGSPVTVGQKRATILQTAGMDWNKGIQLNGTDEYLSESPSIFDPTADNQVVHFSAIQEGAGAGAGVIFGYRDEANELIQITFQNATQLLVQVRGSDTILKSDAVSIVANSHVSGTLTYNGSSKTATLVTNQGTASISGFGTVTAATNLTIGASLSNPPTFASFFNGVIARMEVNGTNALQATQVGTPSNYLIPESDTTPSNDALGNAIAIPRPTSDTWNLFGDGEYGVVADADSLDVTTEATWEIWGNFYNLSASPNEAFFTKFELTAGRSWGIFHIESEGDGQVGLQLSANGTAPPLNYRGDITVGNTLQHIVYVYNGTTVVAYINGASTTVTNLGDRAIPASLYVGTDDVLIGAWDPDAPAAFADRQISRPKIYNRALTADEVLQNYNAQKGAFGL